MLSMECLRELRESWFPHTTDSGLARLIGLLEEGSPLLIAGCFTKSTPMGCLATHVAWNHPHTRHLTNDAGILWLTRVAGLNPATSALIREWDARGPSDWELCSDLLAELRAESARRGPEVSDESRELQFV